MIKLSSRRAAFVLSGSALVLTGAILPAQAAATPGWRINATYPVAGGGNEILMSVGADGPADAWTAGFSAGKSATSFQPVIQHWTGKAWAKVTLPARIARSWRNAAGLGGQIGASSPRNVWVFSSGTGSYLRLKGTRWSLGKLPAGTAGPGNLLEITSVKVFSSTSVWAFGAAVKLTTTAAAVPYAAHYNGHGWTTETVAGTGMITSVSAASSSSIWAVVGTPAADAFLPIPGSGQPRVLHWTGATGWQEPAQPVLPAGASLTSVLTEAAGQVLVGGSVKNADKGTTPLAATWSGTAWAVANVSGPSSAKWDLASLAPDGHGGVWAVAFASNRPSAWLWHLAGTSWSLVKPSFGKRAWILTQLASVPGTGSTWGVGATRAGNSAVGMIAVAGPTPR